MARQPARLPGAATSNCWRAPPPPNLKSKVKAIKARPAMLAETY